MRDKMDRSQFRGICYIDSLPGRNANGDRFGANGPNAGVIIIGIKSAVADTRTHLGGLAAIGRLEKQTSAALSARAMGCAFTQAVPKSRPF